MNKLFFKNELINSTIKKQLERKLEKHGNIKYAYAIMNKRSPSNFSVISNWERKWCEFYTQHNFQFTDPVLLAAAHRITPFSWSENIILKLPKLFDMAKEYNVVNGYTFVLHDQNHNLIVLSLVADKDSSEDAKEILDKDKGNIQLLLMTTHEKLTSLYKDLNSKSDFYNMNIN